MTEVEQKRAARKRINCKECDGVMMVDFNEAEFGRLMKVRGRKKIEERTFFLFFPHCGVRNEVASTNKNEWGDRKAPSFGAILFTGAFSCLMIVGGMAVVGFFAWQGIKTIFGW